MSAQSGFSNKEFHLLSPALPSDRVVSATSSRYDGNMSLVCVDTREALSNRRVFLRNFGIDSKDLVCARQVHGASVSCVTEKDKGSGSRDTGIADTDALVTDIKRLPLAIFTADCLSVFLYDPQRPAVGLVHAGWKSTQKNITIGTLRLMEKNFGTRAKDLLVGFGPAIRGCCYSVGKDFEDIFTGELVKSGQYYYLDLVRINSRQLLDSGVFAGNISDCRVCTSCRHADFFSYRREGESCGRMMSVAMLK